MLNKLKVMENSTFIYTHWAPSLKLFFEKLPTHMCPMSTHVWTTNEGCKQDKVNNLITLPKLEQVDLK
jgi:hypothetical protein